MPDKSGQHPHFDDTALVNVETRHETTDVNVRALLWFIAIFIAFAFVTHGLLFLMFKFFVQISKGAAANAPQTSLARPVDANIPRLPRLQPFPGKNAEGADIAPISSTPVTDMEAMRASQEAVLASYGWVNQSHGVVRIPIGEAKKLMLKRGLFAVTGAAAPSASAQSGKAVTEPAQPAGAVPQVVVPPATGTSGSGH